MGQKAPRAVIEAFPGDVDVVGVQDAMHETCRHPVGRRLGGVFRHFGDQLNSQLCKWRFGIQIFEIMGRGVACQHFQRHRVLQVGLALKAADPQVPVR